ncbi:hypothetical protein TNCT_97721 [Trichonephila clavata]|uniref:Uncharacterized protein n=1 Tax=Trichonephila clavata TaxID=2740835 RepID=A0A8X6F1H6_TRICU|nr:hypothetical protein TNCT_97721 [Trichonephila clavata]
MEYDMLNALKNVKSKAKEMISTVSHGGKVGRIHDISKESSISPAEFGYVENGVLYSGEDPKKYSYNGALGFPVKEIWEMYQKHKLGKPVFTDPIAGYNDINSNRPSLLSGYVPHEIIKELCSGKMKDHKITFAALEENLDENYIPFPVARLAIDGKDPFCLRSLLEASKCKEYGVNAVTICKPDENKTRGVRLTLLKDENGQEVRSYEVINGTYEMVLGWYVEGKKCEMKISISDDGSAKILKRNGVTDEQIYAHTEIMVGKQHETNFLYEALGLDLQQGQAKPRSFEGITPMLNKRSELKAVQASSSKDSKDGAKIEQLLKDDPEAKSALKELGSELQKESSEVARPSTDMAKPDVKEVGEKKEEKKISSPNR